MSEIIVVYWSGTGNTEAMAQFVGKGIQDAGKNADVVSVSEISPETLKNYPVFALGCPSMGSEELEEMEMEPFIEAVEGFAAGKKIGLFGSYGWGDGEWMRIWTERMQQAGAVVINDEGVICNEAPDETAAAECESLGAALAAAL